MTLAQAKQISLEIISKWSGNDGFTTLMIPVIRNMPAVRMSELLPSVNPMQEPPVSTRFHLEFVGPLRRR